MLFNNKKLKLRIENLTLNTGVDELSSVHSFDGDEVFNSLLVSVCISEDNLGKRGTSTGVMNDISDDTLNVTMIIKK